MQLTGHAGRHLSHPLQSSGTITTSAPWLKIAPNCDGQCRRQASQLMHSDISIRSGGFFHLGFRSCASMRSIRVPAAMAPPAYRREQLFGSLGRLNHKAGDGWDQMGRFIGTRQRAIAMALIAIVLIAAIVAGIVALGA